MKDYSEHILTIRKLTAKIELAILNKKDCDVMPLIYEAVDLARWCKLHDTSYTANIGTMASQSLFRMLGRQDADMTNLGQLHPYRLEAIENTTNAPRIPVPDTTPANQ